MSWSIGVATGACTERPIVDVIEALPAGLVQGIEIGTPPRHFVPFMDTHVAALRDRLQARALSAISIHAPFGGLLDLAQPNPRHRHAAIGAILTAAGALKRLGGRIVVVHPSDMPRQDADVSARVADATGSLRTLASSLAAEGMTMAVESPLPHLIGGQPEEFGEMLRHLPPSVGVCLDTGHTFLGRSWDRFIDVAGHRVVHVHAHDNHGHHDDHLPPGDGHIDWQAITRSLVSIDYRGWIMLELRCPETDLGAYVGRALAQARALLPAGDRAPTTGSNDRSA